MKLALAIVLAGLFSVGAASAKTKKPTVCMTYIETTMPVDGVATKAAICTDGSKPVILTSYTVQTIKNEDGDSVRVAIGWR